MTMQSQPTPVVAVVYKTLPHYRLRFYELLRDLLAESGVELRLIYGQPSTGDAMKGDTRDLDWAIPIRNRYLTIGSLGLIWQPCHRLLQGADLIIVEQANKLLLNYVLLLERALGLRRIGYWGHGRNFQCESQHSPSELAKRSLIRHVDWWFAYNEATARLLQSAHYPQDKTTVVQNATDTATLIKEATNASEESVYSTRESLGVPRDAQVCAYVGGMYPLKRLDYLLTACDTIRSETPSFHMVFVGGGESSEMIERAASTRPWIHHLGPLFGPDLVRVLKTCELLLVPASVGLVVLDSFALEIPLIAVEGAGHGPEIEYLDSGVNGILLPADTPHVGYAKAVTALLSDRMALASLQSGCKDAATTFTIENMAANFANGILAALDRYSVD